VLGLMPVNHRDERCEKKVDNAKMKVDKVQLQR